MVALPRSGLGCGLVVATSSARRSGVCCQFAGRFFSDNNAQYPERLAGSLRLFFK